MAPSSESAKVLAVVVTYNPDDKLLDRLQALRDQVNSLLVVDNGSKDAENIEALAQSLGCQVMLNGVNLGLAAALNQGARAAAQQEVDWLATFDQDSVVPSGAIATLLEMAESITEQDRVAILAMSHSDSGTGRDYHRPGEILEQGAHWREVRTTITSGSFIRMTAFDRVGLFDEDLFIDMVDIDFCQRCRKQGMQVLESRAVTLAHTMGDSTIRHVLGRPIVLTRHSPLRRYYITRNQFEMCRRYILADPRWVMGTVWDLLSGCALVLLLEERRWEKFRAMTAGARDFALRRFGPRSRT